MGAAFEGVTLVLGAAAGGVAAVVGVPFAVSGE